MGRYSKEEKEWFRYLLEILNSNTSSEVEKEEAERLLGPVDHRVFNIPPSDLWDIY